MSKRQPSRVGWFLFGFLTALACVATAVVLSDFVRQIAGVVKPSRPAEETMLASDLQTVRSQLELYKIQHLERYPHLDGQGKLEAANFVARLTGRTDQSGSLNPSGAFGPYLSKFPGNPFVRKKADKVSFGTGPPPGDRTTGWYFNTQTGQLFANDRKHKDL